jgi:RNA polymerase sigma-70 factor, ECF subfamily
MTLNLQIMPHLQLLKEVVFSSDLSHHDREDVYQELLVKLLSTKNLPQEFGCGYLVRSARNYMYDHFRRVQAEFRIRETSVTVDSVKGLWNVQNDTPVSIALQRYSDINLLRADIQKAVLKLSDAERQVFELWSTGMHYDDIAKRTGSKVGTVRSRLFYIRKKLCFDLKQWR